MNKLNKIAKQLLEDELNGKCIGKVVLLSNAFTPCYRASCDGYGAYEIDGEVYFCEDYSSLSGREE